MIMRTGGLWQPTPTKVPSSFAGWLKNEYGSGLTVAWNQKTFRWAVFAENPRTKGRTYLLTVEGKDGEFMELNDGAKRLIRENVLHRSQVGKSDAHIDNEIRAVEAKERVDDANFMRDVLTDPVNARRMVGNSSRKIHGATARKAIQDRKKRGE